MQNSQKNHQILNQLQKSSEQIKKSKLIEQKIKQSIKVIGDESKYQVTMIIFFTICFFLATYQFLSSSFYFMNPIFQCDGVSTSQEQACSQLQRCVIINDYTITAENKLYCERKGSRNLIQSLYGVGSVIGVIFVNFLSDLQGRKFSLILSMSVQVVSMVFLLIGASQDIVSMMALAQILMGFSSGSLLSLSYVFTDKMMSKKWTDRSILITNGVGSLSEISMVIFSNYSNWRVLAQYVVLIPSILLVIFAFFFVAEDPILLYSKHNFVECQKSIAKMAKVNNKEENLPQAYQIVKQLQEKNIVLDNQKYSLLKKLSYLKIMASKKILIPALLLASHALGCNFYYYTLNYSISNVGTSYSLNIFLFGVAQFLGMFPLMFISHKIPRKYGQIFLVFTLIAISLLFLIDLSIVMQTILLAFARFVLMSQYAIYIYLAVQTFPQHIQSTAFGFAQLFGQSGKLIAPFEINLAEALQLNPIAVMGVILAILALTPLFFLKETLKPGSLSKAVENKVQENQQESKKDLQEGLLIQ